MALDTYGGLKTEIAAWIARADLTTQIPSFVRLCHAQLMRDLRGHLRLQRRDDAFALTGEYTPVPADFLELVSLSANGKPMKFAPADSINTLSSAAGVPTEFTLVGGSTENFRFSPPPPAGQTAVIEYYARLPFFQTDGATNWILDQAPDLYLNGSLFHAYVFAQDVESAQGVRALYDYTLQSVRRAGNRARWGGNGMAVRVA
jgi:hypothetical protein